MDKKEIAKIINKDISTLYNWEKRNPVLYKAVYEYFNMEEFKEKVNFKLELLELIEKLSEEEQEMYVCEMKARILRKKLDK